VTRISEDLGGRGVAQVFGEFDAAAHRLDDLAVHLEVVLEHRSDVVDVLALELDGRAVFLVRRSRNRDAAQRLRALGDHVGTFLDVFVGLLEELVEGRNSAPSTTQWCFFNWW